MNELVGGLGYAVKNWWMSLLLGLLYIAVALCLLFAPVSNLLFQDSTPLIIQKQNPVVILLLKVTSTPSSDKPKCLIKA